MVIDAIILAGGRSTRLDGVDKTILRGADGRTTVDHAVDSCVGARRIVLVGPRPESSVAGGRIVWTREDPPCSGPARAIAAGLGPLSGEGGADWVLVLAGDMPQAAQAVDALVRALPVSGDGLVAQTSDGRAQWLLGVYRREALARACASLGPGGTGESVRRLVSGLSLEVLPVSDSDAADLDTWEQAKALGFHRERKDDE